MPYLTILCYTTPLYPAALSPGEIAGIAVGCVVFLILIIIIIVWCFYCGCDCDCDDRPMHRYPSNDDVYVRQAVPAVRPQFVQAAPLQTTCVVPPPQPTIQVIKAPNFQHSVIPQQQVVSTMLWVHSFLQISMVTLFHQWFPFFVCGEKRKKKGCDTVFFGAHPLLDPLLENMKCDQKAVI